MGKTDKDRPFWVREKIDYGVPEVRWQDFETEMERDQHFALLHRFWGSRDSRGESLFGRRHAKGQRNRKQRDTREERYTKRKQIREGLKERYEQ